MKPNPLVLWILLCTTAACILVLLAVLLLLNAVAIYLRNKYERRW